MNLQISAQNLNKVLNFLATSPFARPIISDADLLKEIKRTGLKIDANELHEILNKLVDGNYVKREGRTIYEKNTTSYKMYYSIKMEGLALNKNGGFNEKANLNFQYSVNPDSRNIQMQKRNSVVAAAGVSASLLLERAAWTVAVIGTIFLVLQVI